MIHLANFDPKSDIQRLIEWVDSERLKIIWSSKKFNYPLITKELETHFEETFEGEIWDRQKMYLIHR